MPRDGIQVHDVWFGLRQVRESLAPIRWLTRSGRCHSIDLVRDGKSRSRPPSETGCINVTVYKLTGYGGGLPPPERPTEQLDLPVSMDGTLWELCVTYVSAPLWRTYPE